jgi:hypothetical protein
MQDPPRCCWTSGALHYFRRMTPPPKSPVSTLRHKHTTRCQRVLSLSYLDVSVHGRVTSSNCSPSVLSIFLFGNTVKWRPRSSKRLTVAKVNTLKECRRWKKKSFHYNERFLILVSIVTFYLFITRRFLLRNEFRRYPLYDWWFHADSSYSRSALLFDFTGQGMC